MRGKLLLIAYRAYGDWLYTVPVLPFLFEKYDVHLECNNKVFELAGDDPRFCGITMFDANSTSRHSIENEDFDLDAFVAQRISNVIKEIQPDRVIDLTNTLERKCMAMRDQEIFSAESEERRKGVGSVTFYDGVFEHIGVPKDKIILDSMWFSDEQKENAENWRKKHTSDFLVVVPLVGSCMQKFYSEMPTVISGIVEKYHNAHVVLVGPEGCLEGDFKHPRVRDLTGKLPIKQAVLMTKYADYVIGPETGILVAAGMFGTPKTMLCTSTSVRQACSYHQNDYSLQSAIGCSPCHKGIYTEEDCDSVIQSAEGLYSKCVHGFNIVKIFEIIETIYERNNIYNKHYYKRYVERAKSDIGKRLYQKRWEIIEKYCSGEQSLLDYGCASGAFHKSSRNGFVTFGYDVNPNSEFHKSLNGKYDILTMWDVVEHLHDPKETIKAYDPEYLFISTPNLHDGVEFDSWKHNRPNEHLQYFDEKKISGLLDESGYRVLEVNYEEGQIRDPERPRDILTVAAVRK